MPIFFAHFILCVYSCSFVVKSFAAHSPAELLDDELLDELELLTFDF